MQKSLLLSTAAFAAFVTAAHATEDVITPPKSETVVVSATRTEQPLILTGADMSVITAQDRQTQNHSQRSPQAARNPRAAGLRADDSDDQAADEPGENHEDDEVPCAAFK